MPPQSIIWLYSSQFNDSSSPVLDSNNKYWPVANIWGSVYGSDVNAYAVLHAHKLTTNIPIFKMN